MFEILKIEILTNYLALPDYVSRLMKSKFIHRPSVRQTFPEFSYYWSVLTKIRLGFLKF